MKTTSENNWQATGRGNLILCFPRYVISYNPSVAFSIFDALCPSGGFEETAIIHEGEYYILNGDFRKDYEKASKKGGLEACMSFYEKKKRSHRSVWSTNDN